jgi:uncharacterized membrane protein
MKKKTNKKIADAMSDNPLNWKGPFYFNKKDSRIFVPKHVKLLGWTLNFANLYTYFILLACVIVVAFVEYSIKIIMNLK